MLSEALFVGLELRAERVPDHAAPFVEIGERHPLRDGYSIATGRVANARPRRAALRERAGLVLFCPRGELAGTIRYGSAYVHPDHRGRGLGPEMMAELYVTYEELLQHKARGWHGRPYTPAGAHSMRKAYRLLVERGVIKSPEGGVEEITIACRPPDPELRRHTKRLERPWKR